MHDTTAEGTNAPTYESSSSAGGRETPPVVQTPTREVCDALGCDRDGDPVRVVGADTDAVRESVRCAAHAKDFLEVSS